METNTEQSDFLGNGWNFPLALDAEGIALAEGADDIGQAILLILGTIPGERLMLPKFGCAINELVFAPANTVTSSLAEGYVQEALDNWEPRISDINVTAEIDSHNQGVIKISIGYVIRSSNVAQNLVYPFYLEGGGDLPPDYKTDDT